MGKNTKVYQKSALECVIGSPPEEERPFSDTPGHKISDGGKAHSGPPSQKAWWHHLFMISQSKWVLATSTMKFDFSYPLVTKTEGQKDLSLTGHKTAGGKAHSGPPTQKTRWTPCLYDQPKPTKKYQVGVSPEERPPPPYEAGEEGT